MPPLPPESLRLADAHAADARFHERLFDVVELERLDIGFDLFHRFSSIPAPHFDIIRVPIRVQETKTAFQRKFALMDRRTRAGKALDRSGDTRDLADLFADLRFADPAKAASLWKRLAPPADGTPPPPENIAELLEELASSPDPDMALLNLVRFVEATIAPGRFLSSVYLASPVCRLLVTVFSCSTHLTDILRRFPGSASWLMEAKTLEGPKAHSVYRSELARQIEPFRDPRRRLNSVKRYFRRETLRIGVRDLMGLAPVEELTAELSFLADAVVETVAEMAFEELAETCGPGPTAWSYDHAVPYHRLAVISLGKLGGTELNYSSDIDLLFACEITEGERERAFYTALARRVTELLTAQTEEGTLYRVDLRLRPDGDSGPIVVTLDEHLSYLQRRAKPWERQALLKARYTAGNRPVAEAFIDNCERIVFGPAPDIDPLDEILTMRERAIALLSGEERAGNIKLMSGGIRDIEFIAQAMQLVHGRARPGIRTRNTLEALERLHHYGLLSDEVRDTLARSYRLFRTIEHRLQMAQNVQTHTLPADETALAALGARVARSALRNVAAEDVRAELSRSVTEVQHIFAGCFRDRRPGDVPLLLSLPADDGAVEEILARYGIGEGEQSHRFLGSLVFGDFPRLEGPGTLAAAVKHLPGILEEVSRTPEPSLTLRNLVRIAKASGAAKSTIELLGGGGDFLRLLLAVASLSTTLSDLLARRIELLDLIAEGAPPSGAPPLPAARDGSPRFLDALARRHEETLLLIHSRHPIPQHGPEVLGPLYADASESALKALFAKNASPARGLALFAAGSLATRSARFGSDLDLLAIGRDEMAAPAETGMIRALIEDAREAGLGQVDMRLRGEGESAPLVQTLAFVEGYLQTRARPWELLAYAKCRFVCGDAETGAAFEAMLRRTLPALFLREGWKGRLLESRAALASLSRSAWDVKHAAGGLYDIDFILAAARFAGVIDGAPSAEHARELERLREAGLIGGDDPAALLEAFRVFWTIEHAAALHGFLFPPLPERESFFEGYFGRLFGERAAGETSFLDWLDRERRVVREVFDRFFSEIR